LKQNRSEDVGIGVLMTASDVTSANLLEEEDEDGNRTARSLSALLFYARPFLIPSGK